MDCFKDFSELNCTKKKTLSEQRSLNSENDKRWRFLLFGNQFTEKVAK